MRRAKLALFWLCHHSGVFALSRWLTRRHLKILCYHGLALEDECAFRPKLFISPAAFASRLDTLARRGMCVLPLQDAVRRLYAGTLPANAVVITLDDGFHSVHRLAAPCLQRHGFAATVYVTSYYVRHAVPIFRLVVQYMFWKTRQTHLPPQAWCALGAVDLTKPAHKNQALWDCIRHGEGLADEAQRSHLCEALGVLLDTPYADIVQSRKLQLMVPAELQALAQSGVDVQLHTHRHVFPMDQAQAQREIADNRAALQHWVAGALCHFCYPSGLWSPRQWAWLDAMGVHSAVTCLPGLNGPRTPRYALRRFLDGDNIHPLEFEAALSGLPDGLRAWLGR